MFSLQLMKSYKKLETIAQFVTQLTESTFTTIYQSNPMILLLKKTACKSIFVLYIQCKTKSSPKIATSSNQSSIQSLVVHITHSISIIYIFWVYIARFSSFHFSFRAVQNGQPVACCKTTAAHKLV